MGLQPNTDGESLGLTGFEGPILGAPLGKRQPPASAFRSAASTSRWPSPEIYAPFKEYAQAAFVL